MFLHVLHVGVANCSLVIFLCAERYPHGRLNAERSMDLQMIAVFVQ